MTLSELICLSWVFQQSSPAAAHPCRQSPSQASRRGRSMLPPSNQYPSMACMQPVGAHQAVACMKQ